MIIPSQGVTINGTDLAALGVVVRDPDGLLTPAPRTVAGGRSSGAIAGVRLLQGRALGERTLSLKGRMWADSAANLWVQLGALTAVLDDGPVRIASNYASGYELLCEWTGAPLVGDFPALRHGFATIEMTFAVPDPRYRATSDTVVALTDGVAASCVQGSAPSEPEITITATGSGCTNPTVTLLTSADVVQETLTLDLTIATGDAVTVNVGQAPGVIRKTVSGTTTSALDAITNHGAFPTFLRLDPRLGTSPKLKVSLASGTATMAATYRKRAW